MTDQTNTSNNVPIKSSTTFAATASYSMLGGAGAYILVWYLQQIRGIPLGQSAAEIAQTSSQLQAAFTPILAIVALGVVGFMRVIHNVCNKVFFNGEDVI